MRYVMQNCTIEWSYESEKVYSDPFNDIELSVIFIDPDKEEKIVPAFWDGENTWRVRYSSPKIGRHTFRTVSSDPSNSSLNDQKGELEIVPYEGDNPLFKHGPIKVSENKRHLEYIDGTPFFWLGDTWWMGLCKRLSWPEEFQILTQDRVEKGFSVIQIVAGLYPDMPPFDPRGANEAGFPWEKDYSTINPDYFDMADLRISWLIRSGLVPCIVGCWGYYLPWLGIEKMKKHWRYLVARYSAFPVVWCLAGEYDMPYYLSKEKEKDKKTQKDGWIELGRYLCEIDPYHHPITVHPGTYARENTDILKVLDFDMLQTGHSDNSLRNTVFRVQQSYYGEPRMPVVNGEVCYEGIGGQCKEQIQRLMFWATILNGACGYTYGANGIWQVNRKDEPFGPSPHGMSWGDTPWEEAYKFPGSKQLGIAKRLLEKYQWWKFEPHPEWIEVEILEENRKNNYYPYCAGIPREVRIIYLPFFYNNFKIKDIEEGVSYRTFLFNPVDGKEFDIGLVVPDENREWQLPELVEGSGLRVPIYQDWILVLEVK
ncbi:MAG: DUF4038 domain-containing protein [bacterium]